MIGRWRASTQWRHGTAILAAMFVCHTMLYPLVGQPRAEDIQDPFEEVREYLKTGRYDKAETALQGTLENARASNDFELLRLAYLLLIKTYTVRGNFFLQTDEQTATLYHDKAMDLTRKCLQEPRLRRTYPDSPLEYPPEMFAFFDKVRSEIFGSFRVINRDPPEAFVIFDGDTLQTSPGETSILETHIPIGAHEVVVAFDGYRTLNDAVTITSGATLEKTYKLEKNRSKWFYAGLTSGAAAVAYVILALIDNPPPPPAEDPLPAAPDPPPNPQ